MRDDLERLAARWRTENGDYPEAKRDCADELDALLAQQSAAPVVPAADRPIDLPINDAVPSATRIEPGNLFLWNWQKMQEYARACVEADRASVTFAPKPEAQKP